MKAMMDIAEENRVAELPSILLIDKKGKPYIVIPGEFDEIEVEKSIEQIVDGLVRN